MRNPLGGRRELGLCLFLCLWLAAGEALAAPRCKTPYIRVQEQYCYHVAPDTLHTSFNDYCYQEKRTSRVCLDSVEEMRALARFLYGTGFEDGTRFWSAGNRWAGDRQFYWNYYGRARPLNYTNWLPDEPSPGMGRNCLLLTLSDGELVMSSESCHTKAFDVCEMLRTNEPTVMH